MNIETFSERDVRDLSFITPDLTLLHRDLYHIIRQPGPRERFFGDCLGRPGVDLTTTNMELPGQLPCGCKAIVEGFSLEWHPQVPLIGSCTLVLGCQTFDSFAFHRTPHLRLLDCKPVIPSNFSFMVDITLATVYNRVIVCPACGAVAPKSPCEYCGNRHPGTLLQGLEYFSVTLRTIYIRPRC
jgi:hypothetical protein